MNDAGLDRLVGIVRALRAPDGCPWDRAQTLASLRHHLLEEAYEVADVMADDAMLHCEELGDLLFQIVLQSQLREERGEFRIAQVVAGISDKLERRHPHVFGDEPNGDVDRVNLRWEELKRAEGKGGPGSVPRAFPALMRAAKVTSKASRVGFDWPSVEGPLAKIDEETAELRAELAAPDPDAARRRARVAAELGDLLFAVVNVARHLGVHPEEALDGATDRFLARYGHVESALGASGRAFDEVDAAELDALWEAAKAHLGGAPAPEPRDG
ncbi:MAG: nucleoside triphosphate pyrophosphohydrolase [Deltaproteobacteria bacterium HGW-Deltaproteobacteria-14]|jgi:MazG family protein|nr:MAG: nucleoside triphosphate pyrophosphohydrolase [Deltaproteobacteria bacterium HGW-Deltaproteobacteria-14]